jgi:hypothetical protein
MTDEARDEVEFDPTQQPEYEPPPHISQGDSAPRVPDENPSDASTRSTADDAARAQADADAD